MENIDDLMRQKFDSDDPEERFEFREEYWEQAQALLEQDEAQRSRRLWRFIGGVLAMVLLVWFLMLLLGVGSLSKKKPETERAIGENMPRREESSKHTVPEDRLQSIEIEKANSSKAGNPLEKNAESGSKAASQDLRALSQGKSQLSGVDKKSATKPDNTSNTHGKYTLSNENNTKDQVSKVLLGIETSQQDQIIKSNLKNSSDVENTPAKASQHEEESPVNTPPILPAVAQAKEGATPPVNIPIFNIPTPLNPLVWPERAIVPRKPLAISKEPIAEQTKPVQDHRFSFGFSLAGAAYRRTKAADRWAGWAAGVYGDYRLNKNWSLTLGAQERFVPGYAAPADSTDPAQVEQLRYSFGYKRDVWKRETRGLHYLEFPLSARWQKGRWAVEGGAAVGVLWAVQNRTEHTTESSLEAAKTTVKKFVRGNAAPFNQTCFSAFAGAEYRLNDRISVMTRTQYRFTPVLKTAGDGVKNNGLGNLEWGLKIRLF